jgi:hypothetical protein
MLEIGERVSVIAAFGVMKRLKPVRFSWAGRQVEIREITSEWTTSKGRSKLLHFSATDGSTLYELSFDLSSAVWRLERVEAGI